jgi:hypothetical protein
MLWIDFIPLAAQFTCMAAALLLIRLGTRIQQDLPHCAACKFDLSAHGFEFHRGFGKVIAAPGSEESDRAVCPECGTRLTPYDSVRFVLKRFNWRLCGPGLALIFLPFVVMFYATTRGPAAPMVVMNSPESMVIRLGENELDHRYIDELLRRIRAGELSKPALEALTSRTIARTKQRTRMSERYKFTEQLLGALIDTGAITPGDLASILGEPRVNLHLASRTYRDWAPIVRASAVVDTPNIPDRLMVSVENVTAYLTDVLDSRGQMTQWEVIDGSARAGGMSDGQTTSSGSRVLSLRPTPKREARSSPTSSNATMTSAPTSSSATTASRSSAGARSRSDSRRSSRRASRSLFSTWIPRSTPRHARATTECGRRSARPMANPAPTFCSIGRTRWAGRCGFIASPCAPRGSPMRRR